MFKYLLTILKYACPPLAALLPCLVVVGMLSPWPVAETALGSSAAGGALLIGWEYSAHTSGAESHERREQIYAVMPTLKTITVIQEDGNVRTEDDPKGLISAFAGYASVLFGTWWFWLRRKPSEAKK